MSGNPKRAAQPILISHHKSDNTGSAAMPAIVFLAVLLSFHCILYLFRFITLCTMYSSKLVCSQH